MPHLSARRWLLAATAVTTIAAFAAPSQAATPGPAPSTSTGGAVQQSLHRLGTANLGQLSRPAAARTAAPSTNGPEYLDREVPDQRTTSTATPSAVPNPTGRGVSRSTPRYTGFTGLVHADQRLANNGNQYSLVPPDQAVCATNGTVLESVNDVLQVYRDNSTLLTGVVDLNTFFGLAAQINRQRNPVVYGPFLSDPKCYYDPQTARWFLTVLEIDTNPYTGAFGYRSATLLAVSQTSDPTGAYTLFSIDATDDGSGGTPKHPNCPCLGDQPLIGADSNGFYISTNEFPLATAGFNGAQIYALSKKGIVAAADLTAAMPPVVHLQGGMLQGQQSYTIQPATTPPGGRYAPNREYFLSAGDFLGSSDNQVFVWALDNTASLSWARPAVHLTHASLASERYATPPPAAQRPGPRPLGSSLGAGLPKLNSDDDRMQQVVYSNGRLYSSLNTGIGSGGAASRVAAAWFVVTPTFGGGQVGGRVTGQGYVAVANNNVLFPAVAVNSSGQGAMVFTVVGPDYYPSAAYIPVGLNGAVSGPVRIGSGIGLRPADQFDCYKAFGGNGVCRWGDYSAAVAEGATIVMATEYIPNVPRTALANWGTFVATYAP